MRVTVPSPHTGARLGWGFLSLRRVGRQAAGRASAPVNVRIGHTLRTAACRSRDCLPCRRSVPLRATRCA